MLCELFSDGLQNCFIAYGKRSLLSLLKLLRLSTASNTLNLARFAYINVLITALNFPKIFKTYVQNKFGNCKDRWSKVWCWGKNKVRRIPSFRSFLSLEHNREISWRGEPQRQVGPVNLNWSFSLHSVINHMDIPSFFICH